MPFAQMHGHDRQRRKPDLSRSTRLMSGIAAVLRVDEASLMRQAPRLERRLTMALIQVGAKGDVHPFETG
jgi:hypothetical protein